MKFLKQLFCFHIWETISERLLDKRLDGDTYNVDTFYRFLKHERCAKCEKQQEREVIKLEFEL